MTLSRHNEDSPLAPYRILDLTEGGCMICARMLGDLGADVIRVEPPGGSLSRTPPFYNNIPDPEKSLFWFAYCANKRGITLNIESADGQEIFKKLVKNTNRPVNNSLAVDLYESLVATHPRAFTSSQDNASHTSEHLSTVQQNGNWAVINKADFHERLKLTRSNRNPLFLNILNKIMIEVEGLFGFSSCDKRGTPAFPAVGQ